MVISRLIRDEASGGFPVSVSIKRLSVASNIGRQVQVTSACMLETMLPYIFKENIDVVPRTEENCSALYFTIPSVETFLFIGYKHKFISNCDVYDRGEEHEEEYEEEHEEEHEDVNALLREFLKCRVHVHITYVGNIFFRFAWDKEQLKTPFKQITKAEAIAENVSNKFITILKFLC